MAYAKDKLELPLEAPVFTPDLDEVGQTLMRAADAIRKYGHTKKKLTNDYGSMCLVGAINFAVSGDALQFPHQAKELAYSVARHLSLNSTAAVVSWNNAPERTAAEVIAALESAALRPGEARHE